jgi:hypothetical protein
MILALPITFLATDKRWKTPLLAFALPSTKAMAPPLVNGPSHFRKAQGKRREFCRQSYCTSHLPL